MALLDATNPRLLAAAARFDQVWQANTLVREEDIYGDLPDEGDEDTTTVAEVDKTEESFNRVWHDLRAASNAYVSDLSPVSALVSQRRR